MKMDIPHKTRSSEGTTKGGGKRKNRDLRRALRREQAEERQALANGRTVEERLTKLQEGGHGKCAEGLALAAWLRKL